MKMSQLIVRRVIPNNFQNLLDHKLKANILFFLLGWGSEVRRMRSFLSPKQVFLHLLPASNPPPVNSFSLSGAVHRCRNVLTINFSLGIVNRTSHQEVAAAQQGT